MTALRQPSPSEQPRVTALSQTSQEVLEAIRQAYTFVESENEAAVFGILATRPDVAAVLLEALPHVASIFGERTPILLMAVDHHTGEPLSLAARVQTSDPVSKALAKQRDFYRTWWLSVPGVIDDVLSFGV